MLGKIKDKKCKNFANCGNLFTPRRTTDAYCSPGCAYKLNERSMRNIKTMAFKAGKARKEPARRIKMKQMAKQRDLYRCLLAGRIAHTCDFRREAHHIIYLSEGGPDELWNLITLCGYAHHQIAHRQKALQPTLLEIVNGRLWFHSIPKEGLSDRIVQKLQYLQSVT